MAGDHFATPFSLPFHCPLCRRPAIESHGIRWIGKVRFRPWKHPDNAAPNKTYARATRPADRGHHGRLCSGSRKPVHRHNDHAVVTEISP